MGRELLLLIKKVTTLPTLPLRGGGFGRGEEKKFLCYELRLLYIEWFLKCKLKYLFRILLPRNLLFGCKAGKLALELLRTIG